MMSLSSQMDPQEDPFQITRLLLNLWGERWVILAASIIGLSLAAFYAWRKTPVYRVQAMLQIEPKKVGGGVSALAAISEVSESPWSATSEAQAEIEILRSNLVLGRAVESLRLDITAQPKSSIIFGSALIRRSKEYPVLEIERLDVQKGAAFEVILGQNSAIEVVDLDGKGISKAKIGEDVSFVLNNQPCNLRIGSARGPVGQSFVVSRLHPSIALERLRSNFDVFERGKQTNILGLTFEHPNPARGAEILNSVLDQYVRQNIERKAEEASKTLAFLQEQMPLLKGKLEVAEEKLNQFRAGSRAADLSEEAKLILRQSVDLESQTLALRQKKEELLRTYQEKSDVVSTLDQQLGKLQTESRRLEGQAKSLPRTQQEVVRYMRDVQVNQDLYTALMNNIQQLQVAKAGEIGNARIVDHATPSLTPVKPNKASIILAGAFMGGVLGILFVLAMRLLRNGVDNPRILETSLGIPTLATVPFSQMQKAAESSKSSGNRLLADIDPGDLAIESLKSLRTSLHFAMVDSENNIVAISGPAPQIGKTFISCNFAAVLAQAGSKVLLVDGDLRKGKLHKYFGIEARGNGLSEILSGQIEWQMALREVGGIHIIPGGTIPPNPSELLMNRRFSEFIKEASSYFDFVIIDTPPILAVTDAMIIGSYASAVLVTLKSGLHPMEEIRLTTQRLLSAGVKTSGFIFNSVSLKSGNAGKYGYAYQYDYKSK